MILSFRFWKSVAHFQHFRWSNFFGMIHFNKLPSCNLRLLNSKRFVGMLCLRNTGKSAMLDESSLHAIFWNSRLYPWKALKDSLKNSEFHNASISLLSSIYCSITLFARRIFFSMHHDVLKMLVLSNKQSFKVINKFGARKGTADRLQADHFCCPKGSKEYYCNKCQI